MSDVLDGRPSLVLGLGRPLHADGHEDPQNGRRHESVSHEGIRVHAGGGDWEAREGLGSRLDDWTGVVVEEKRKGEA